MIHLESIQKVKAVTESELAVITRTTLAFYERYL